jgi:hypothetical protein
MKARHLQSDESLWKVAYKDTYDEWISQYRDEKKYPYDVWGDYYDTNVIPYLKEMEVYRKNLDEYRKKLQKYNKEMNEWKARNKRRVR